MRLDDYIEDLEPDEADRKRRLAEQKSYEVLDYVDDVEDRFADATQGDSLVGSTSPSVFVGRSNYPNVSTGILSPVGAEDRAAEHTTGGEWYQRGLGIDDVLQYRTGLLYSNHGTNVTNVADTWDGFLGTQREVADVAQVTEVTIRNRYQEQIEALGIHS